MSSIATTTTKMPSALPPWHTLVILSICCLLSLYYLPSWQSLDDQVANASVLKQSVGYLTTFQIAVARFLLGAVMLGDCLYAILYGKWEQDTEYYPGSKLQPQYQLPFRGVLVERPYSLSRGLLTMSSFTMWAWCLEGIAFWLLAYVAATATTSSFVCRLAVILWEIAAPTSLLVSSIVKYVLWPHALQGNGTANADVFKHPGALLEHNLNSLAALVEVGFFGGLPVRKTDASFAILFGLVYVAYTYAMAHSWPLGQLGLPRTKPDAARQPQFIYPFFDPTLPGFLTTYCLLGLLAVLLGSHLLFCFANVLIRQNPWIAVPFIAVAVCRFRD